MGWGAKDAIDYQRQGAWFIIVMVFIDTNPI